MRKTIAFATSTSKESINKQLVTYATELLEHNNSEVLDLNDFALPLYSVDEEGRNGIPQKAHDFKQKLEEASDFIISIAEHNGNFTAAFKNLYDWVSRIDVNVFDNKKIFLLSTSPGVSGGQNAAKIAKATFNMMGGEVVDEFSLPHFFDNFEEGEIIEFSLNQQLKAKMKQF